MSGPVPVPVPDEQTLAFYTSGNLWYLVWISWAVAVPWLTLRTGAAAWLGRQVARVSERVWVQAALFVAVYTAGAWLVSRPLAFVSGFQRMHAYGLSNQTVGRWLEVSVKGLGVAIVVRAFGAALLYALLVRWRERAWKLAAAVVPPLGFVLVMVWPIWVQPLFHDFGPMQDRALEARILDLADRAGVEGSEVFEVDISKDTKALNAYVAGLAGTKRIVLWDTLLKALEPDEVLVVMGHEIGHYVLDHVLIGFGLACVGIALGLFLCDRSARAALARWGEGWGVRQLASPASYPLLLIVYLGASLAIRPVENFVSRTMEHQADVFAAEITQQGPAGARAFLKLQKTNLGHPRPGPIYKFFRQTHPAIADRIDFYNTYRPWQTGQALRYGDCFRAPED